MGSYRDINPDGQERANALTARINLHDKRPEEENLENIKTIKASCGAECIIDTDDYGRVSQYKWNLRKDGYFVRKFSIGGGKRKTVSMHRFIMNDPPGTEVDHINRDKLDNRKSNLRTATRSQNNMNCSVQNRNKSSKYKGVCLIKNRWRVYIKKKYIGQFLTEEDAALAYNIAAKEIFGEFAYLNTVSPSENQLGVSCANTKTARTSLHDLSLQPPQLADLSCNERNAKWSLKE